jgi:hypothetical protein
MLPSSIRFMPKSVDIVALQLSATSVSRNDSYMYASEILGNDFQVEEQTLVSHQTEFAKRWYRQLSYIAFMLIRVR